MDSTITILNNSNYYSIAHPKYKRVQRPFTEEYARLRQNDWFFRCMKEYDYVKSHGGSVWIPTLTYNNENLPHLDVSEFVQTLPIESTEPNSNFFYNIDESWSVPCFNQYHIQAFTKKLRIYLTRKNYNTLGMKWIVCSEFGEKKHRPHYHVFLSILDKVELEDMKDCLCRAWKYGFVGHSSKFGLECVSSCGVRYATKYVVKDMAYYNTVKLKNGWTLNQFIKHQDSFDEKELRRLFRPFMPNMYCSKGLGRCFESVLSSMSESELYDYALGDRSFSLSLGHNSHMRFRLPQYYISRLSYVVDKDLTAYYDKVIMRLTTFGRELFRLRASRSISKFEELLKKITVNTAECYGAKDDFDVFRSLPTREFASYLGLFRYCIPFDKNYKYNPFIRPFDLYHNKAWYLDSLVKSDKKNIYVCDFLFRHGLVDESWYHENCAQTLRCRVVSRDSAEFTFTSPYLGMRTCSELPQFFDYELAAQAFDRYCDKEFDFKECKKRNKRLQIASDKDKCFKFNPKIITFYESYKDS